ncbi:MAG: phenylalanine--tRNA ligase subunit beta, partial [Acidobacteria bacterium]|nr:phenylalanine--tRNA ligase subunit beta [Acidobacteriota bacterium]
KFRQPVYVAEIDLETALKAPTSGVAYRPLDRYPGISRDVSLLVKRDLDFNSIRSTIREMNFELCTSVDFVDVYEGKGLAEDERSITIRLEYRSPERTLVEDEVNAVHQQILTSLERTLPVKQRA